MWGNFLHSMEKSALHSFCMFLCYPLLSAIQPGWKGCEQCPASKTQSCTELYHPEICRNIMRYPPCIAETVRELLNSHKHIMNISWKINRSQLTDLNVSFTARAFCCSSRADSWAEGVLSSSQAIKDCEISLAMRQMKSSKTDAPCAASVFLWFSQSS